MCNHDFQINMYVQAHILIEGGNKVVVRLNPTKYIGRCGGNTMEEHYYLVIKTWLLFRNCVLCIRKTMC